MDGRDERAGERPGGLVWSLPEPPPRAHGLNRSRVVASAVALADAEGAGALTMRRVAADLGSPTPMSLYRYVGSKDGLLDLMLDAVYGEITLPERPSGDWRADLAALARGLWAAMQRHPWFATLCFARPPLGPRALDYFEYRLSVLDLPGLDAETKHHIAAAIDGHLVGAALGQLEEQRMRQRTGLLTTDQLHAAAARWHAEIEGSGRHPRFAAWQRERPVPTEADDDATLDFALDCLLDGIEARVEQAARDAARG